MEILEKAGADERIIQTLWEEGIEELRPLQVKAVKSGLLRGTSILVTSPSASGKTLIGELATLQMTLTAPKAKVIYLTPIGILAQEKYDEFKRKYTKLGLEIASGEDDSDSIDIANIIVLTFEQFDKFLRENSLWIKSIVTAIIDETYALGDERYGVLLETIIIRLRDRLPKLQLVCLSSNIGNPYELAKWLECIPIDITDPPVPIELSVVSTPSKDESIVTLSSNMVEQGGQVLIFLANRKEAMDTIGILKSAIGSQLTREENEKAKKLSEEFQDRISHSSRLLSNSVLDGLAYHHEGLSPDERESIEEEFKEGLIKVITCTTALGSTTNTPARLVILKDTSSILSSWKDVSSVPIIVELSPNTVHWILSRAGRPKYDVKGYGIILASDQYERNLIIDRYFRRDREGKLHPKYNDVESSIGDQESLQEIALLGIYELQGASEEKIVDFFRKTFWWFRRRREGKPIKELAKLDRTDIDEAIRRHSDQSVRGRAALIPDRNVEITNLHPSKIEARIKSTSKKLHYPVVFDPSDGPSCGCEHWKFKGRFESKMCKHLIKLAHLVMGDEKMRDYALNAIPRSLGCQTVLDYLIEFNQIEQKGDIYNCTDFGKTTSELGIGPDLAVKIKGKIISDESKSPEEVLFFAIELARDNLRDFRYLGKEVFEFISNRIRGKDASPYAVDFGDLKHVLSRIGKILKAIGVISSMVDKKMIADIVFELEKKLKEMV
ncbi:MAG: DEAD/DEAH box helicase [Candidatus Hodarchaeota archaeon]